MNTPTKSKIGGYMEQKHTGPGDLPTGERLKHLGSAMMTSIGQKLSGKEERDQAGAAFRLSQEAVEQLIDDWPVAPRKTVQHMLKEYGPPNVGTPVRLTWYWNGPWKRTEVTYDQISHNFPATHTDFITCWIDYEVPVEFYSDIARFDGSCLLDRTAGEAGGRCDSEAANMITLNLMHEIVTRQRNVEDAREKYAEQMSAYMMGRSAPYAESLIFDPPAGGTTDLDEARIADKMLGQMGGKAKDMISGDDSGVSV